MLKFFTYSSFLNLKKQSRVWLWFVASIVLSVLISVVGAYMASAYLNEGLLAGKMKLGILNKDTHNYSQNFIDILFSNAEEDEALSFIELKSEKEIEEYFKKGEIFGAVIIPDGFVNSMLSGENKAPRIISDARNPIYAVMFEQLGRALSDVLSTAQSGIYSAQDLYYEFSGNTKHMPFDDLIKINTKFMLISLSRLRMFVTHSLTSVGGMSLMEHYIVMLGLFFFMLISAVIAPIFNISDNADALLQFKRLGKLNSILLSRIFVGMLPYFVLCGFTMPFFVHSDVFMKILVTLAAAVFLYSVSLLIYTLSGGITHTATIILGIASYSLFVAGGIIPSAFLPQIINSQKILSPIYHISQMMSSGSVYYSLIIIFVSTVFIFISMFTAKSKLRR